MKNILPNEVHHNDEEIDPQTVNYVAGVNERQCLINEHYRQ